jgi:hypothetical protein
MRNKRATSPKSVFMGAVGFLQTRDFSEVGSLIYAYSLQTLDMLEVGFALRQEHPTPNGVEFE